MTKKEFIKKYAEKMDDTGNVYVKPSEIDSFVFFAQDNFENSKKDYWLDCIQDAKDAKRGMIIYLKYDGSEIHFSWNKERVKEYAYTFKEFKKDFLSIEEEKNE